MSMKMMNAAYLVDNVALLSLQEKQDGVEFHCFDMDSKVQTTEGHIGWDVLDKQPSSTLEERIGSKFRMAVQWRSSIRTGSSQLAANIWTNIICAWGMMFCTSVSWQKCWNAAVVHAARSR